MLLFDMYKVIDDDTPTFVKSESTGETLYVANWKEMPVGWLTKEVKNVRVSTAYKRPPLWIRVE